MDIKQLGQELDRLLYRRGDIDTLMDALAEEKTEVIAAIASMRRRIAQCQVEQQKHGTVPAPRLVAEEGRP